MLVPRRRDGHQHAGRLLAHIGDVVRHARRDEQKGPGCCPDDLIAGVPPSYRVNGDIIFADEDSLTGDECAGMAYTVLTEDQRQKFDRDKMVARRR